MVKIQTIDVDRWSEPDENHRVRHIGMADAQEVFDKLRAHLQQQDLLPDEYFSFSRDLTGELPEFAEVLCVPSFGGSEGIYLDIDLICRKTDSPPQKIHFATGKTLGETADDYMRMFRIAAECSLMLNGCGAAFERNEAILSLTEEELFEVQNVLELELLSHVDPHRQEILQSALQKAEQSQTAFGLSEAPEPEMKM